MKILLLPMGLPVMSKQAAPLFFLFEPSPEMEQIMRLAAQAKAGFYPTPEPIYNSIAKYLVCRKSQNGSVIRILDPCAGTGEPIASIAEFLGKNAEIETYGIEISQERGEIAKKNLTKCLIADYQSTRISNRAFSLLYLNPPYDDDTLNTPLELKQTQRHELGFLKNCLKYLIPQAVLVYLIPQTRISTRIARVLSYNFENIKVFRFPPEAYEQFKQVVIFAELKKTPAKDPLDEKWLAKCGRKEALVPDVSTSWLKNRYEVPQVSPKQKNHRVLFSTNAIKPDDLAFEVKKFGLVDEIIQIFDATHVVDLKTRPIMPMRHGHLAQALASGIMNGVVRDENGDNPLLVKGLTRKIVETRRQGSGENAKIIETERVKIVVKAFNRDGQLLTIE